VSRVQEIQRRFRERKRDVVSLDSSLGICDEWTLVVDTDTRNLEDVCIILDSEGCNIDVAGTGMDALSLVSMREYVLIIFGGALTDMSGQQFLSRVMNVANDSVKIIILDESEISLGFEALQMGADGVVLKPVSPFRLLDVVREKLRERQKLANLVKNGIDADRVKHCRIVACIPAFNEERSLASVILGVQKYVDYVVVCDDGSHDLTAEIARNLGSVVVVHEENRGKGAALRTAFQRAKVLNPDVVVVLDSDGQHDPDEIPKVVEPIILGQCDAVVGSRFAEGADSDPPGYRKFGLKVISFFMKRKVGDEVKDSQSGFRAFSSKALDCVLDTESDGFGVESEQLMRARENELNVMEVPITIRYEGLHRTSTKNPLTHGSEIIGLILRYVVEERPLLLLGFPGFLSVVVGIVFGLWFLWYFNTSRYFSIPLAITASGALIIGTVLIITSLLLYALARLRSIYAADHPRNRKNRR